MNVALMIGALLVSLLLLTWLLKVIKTSIQTAFFIAIVVFLVQMASGIGPQEVFQLAAKWLGSAFGSLDKWLRNWGGNYKPPENFREKTKAMVDMGQMLVQMLISE
ncbi:MAG: hypothetical protein WCO45_14960 [Pseudanabaena sp. ELA607]